MIEFDAIDGRRVTVESDVDGSAERRTLGAVRLVPAAGARGLSTEMLGLCWGATSQTIPFLEREGLVPSQATDLASGRCVAWDFPPAALAAWKLPAGTRMGTLDLGVYVAHGLFYRPSNTFSDVVSYFRSLGLKPARNGVVVPRRRFQVLSERYTTSVPGVGVVDIEHPRGVPTRRHARIRGGAMWVDRTAPRLPAIVLEHPAARLTFPAVVDGRPTSREAPADPVQHERVVRSLAERIASVSWG